MSSAFTAHPRADELNTVAARERWPYTRIGDWLAREPDAAKDHPALPPLEIPAQWEKLGGQATAVLQDAKHYVLQLHAESATWSEQAVQLRVPQGTNATLLLLVQGEGVVDAELTIAVEADATLNLVRVAQLGATARSFEAIQLNLSARAKVNLQDFNLEQGLSHVALKTRLQGEGSDLQLDSLSLLCGRSRAVLQATVTHDAEHAISRLEFRNALADRARRSVVGAVHVSRSGQHTDSGQVCRSLLLSPTAGADMRPELEIYADQVKCAHGATCGELDQTALHYLRSRGLDLLTARRLLLESFALPALRELPEALTPLLDTACHLALSRLGQRLDPTTGTQP